MNTVNLRGKTYQLGRFSDLHLAPIAEFIQNGIKTDESSWGYTARMIVKIVPDISQDLVDPKAGEIYLSVKELQAVYSAALAKIPTYDEVNASSVLLAQGTVDNSLNLISNDNESEVNVLKEKLRKLEEQNKQLENKDK